MQHLTPSIEIFNEIKEAAKQVWRENYSDQYGYVSEKISKIDSLTNYEDNVMVCYRMFDMINQSKMKSKLSQETLDYIKNNL